MMESSGTGLMTIRLVYEEKDKAMLDGNVIFLMLNDPFDSTGVQ